MEFSDEHLQHDQSAEWNAVSAGSAMEESAIHETAIHESVFGERPILPGLQATFESNDVQPAGMEPTMGSATTEVTTLDSVDPEKFDSISANAENEMVWLAVSPTSGPQYWSEMRDELASTFTVDSPAADGLAMSVVMGSEAAIATPRSQTGMLTSQKSTQRKSSRVELMNADVTGCEVSLAFEFGDPIAASTAAASTSELKKPATRPEIPEVTSETPSTVPSIEELRQVRVDAQAEVESDSQSVSYKLTSIPALVVLAGMVWIRSQTSRTSPLWSLRRPTLPEEE